jgi:hypothetical protein
MTPEVTPDDLGLKRVDLVVAFSKGVLGGIPCAGPLLAEAIEHLIPQQRIDRLRILQCN